MYLFGEGKDKVVTVLYLSTTPWRHIGGMEVHHAFFTSALDGNKWSASSPGRFIPTERTPGTHCIWGRVRPRL